MPSTTKTQPVVTLTTDFGLSDHYAAVMKGVIMSICPAARIVDITHDCAPYEISEAAFTVAQAYPYFPKGTVHVVVVDPGVGTMRRPILVETAGQHFVGPDNGVFAFILAREEKRARAITNRKYMLREVSQTFHGRDVFAPAAAHLASGVAPAKLGPVIEDYLRPRTLKPDRTARRAWTGSILKVDRFGNLITNFAAADFPRVLDSAFSLAVGLREVTQLGNSYEQFGPGELFLILGSSGFFEVSAHQASAAKLLGVATGTPIELTIF